MLHRPRLSGNQEAAGSVRRAIHGGRPDRGGHARSFVAGTPDHDDGMRHDLGHIPFVDRDSCFICPGQGAR